MQNETGWCTRRIQFVLLLVIVISILLPGPAELAEAHQPALATAGTQDPVRIDLLPPPGTIEFGGVIDEMVAAVEQTRVEMYMQALEDFGTRYSRSQQNQEAADWLFDTMSGFGLEVRRQRFFHSGIFRENIIATIQGRTRPWEVVVIGAHFDSISEDPYVAAPGADDNASGVAAVLEAARNMAGYEFERTVEFVAFNYEEGSGAGSQAYVADLEESNVDVLGCFNFDMIAWSGNDPAPPDVVIDTNDPSRHLAVVLRDAILHYLPQDLEPVIPDSLMGGSNHQMFWWSGYPAVMGTEAVMFSEEFNPYWHTTEDLLIHCDLEYATNVIRGAVAALAITGLPAESPWDGIVAGPGPSPANEPLVRVFQADVPEFPMHEFAAYGAPHYGVNVSCGDVDGDGFSEIITGAGPGEIYGPHVRGFTLDGTPLPGLSFLAYGTNKYGVNTAAGDLDGDAIDEIVTGAGPGAVFGPHVRAFDYDGGTEVLPVAGVNFFAYGTPKWGVNVAAGDIDGDGFDEILTGAGPGPVYGPHVRGWNVDGETAQPLAAVSFQAYGTYQWGVNVCCGDVDGDGIDEILTGPGPGVLFSAHVRGWNYDGEAVAPLAGLNFLAWPSAEARYGARVATGPLREPDGRALLLVSCGPDPDLATTVGVFLYDGQDVSGEYTFDAFPAEFAQGATLAGGRFQ